MQSVGAGPPFHLETALNYVNGMEPLLKYLTVWNNSYEPEDSFDLEYPEIFHLLNICGKYIIYSFCVLITLTFVTLITFAYRDACVSSRHEGNTYRLQTLVRMLHATKAARIVLHLFVKYGMLLQSFCSYF